MNISSWCTTFQFMAKMFWPWTNPWMIHLMLQFLLMTESNGSILSAEEINAASLNSISWTVTPLSHLQVTTTNMNQFCLVMELVHRLSHIFQREKIHPKWNHVNILDFACLSYGSNLILKFEDLWELQSKTNGTINSTVLFHFSSPPVTILRILY